MVYLTELTQTCLACPSQWDAKTEDGKNIYIRYRWSILSIYEEPGAPLGKQDRAAWHPIFKKIVGSGLDGVMDTTELLKHISWVAELAPNAVVASMEWADAETVQKRFKELFSE